VQQGRTDLVFLDIQMSRLTSLQFLKLSGNKAKVILTAAYTEYALDGFGNNVVDYLLKSIPFERFLKAAHKALALLAPTPPLARPPAALAPTLPVAPAVGHIFVKGDTKNKHLRINHADILYVEGLNNYVLLHLPGQRVATYQTLKELADTLPQPPFLRVHKSYIVSLTHVRLVDRNTLFNAGWLCLPHCSMRGMRQ
jgi:DNA-binding LytR/AlgR family response regulator